MVATTTNSRVQMPDGDIAPFTGIAVTWQTNTKNYRVRPDAVVRTLWEAEVGCKRRGGQMLWPVLSEHSPALAFGWIASAEITEDGLYVIGYLDAMTPECKRAFQAAKDGKVNGLSLGFKTITEHREGAVRVLDEIEIFEISVGDDPIDIKARLSVRSFNESEFAIMRAIAQEKESAKMANYGWIDDDDDGYERPLYGSPHQEPDKPYHIEFGRPEESRQEFEKELRAQRRAEDTELYTLTPGGKAFQREVERRQQERVQKQLAQKAALEAERREIAERQAAMNAETFTPESFAAASGLGAEWSKRWFYTLVNSGRAVPIDENGLVLRAQDVRAAAKRDAELIELEAIRARNKRLEGAA